MKIVMVAMLVFLPLQATAVHAETVTINVEPHSINANGHWLCDDGVGELRLEGGVVYLDGWQIGPDFPNTAPPQAKQPASVQEAVLRELRQKQLAWVAAGLGKKAIVEASKNFLENSGALEGPVQDKPGAWWVPWKGQETPSLMNLSCVAPQQSPLEGQKSRELAARAFLDWIPQQLEKGHMLLFAPGGSFKLIPQSRRQEALRLLNEAKSRSGPITGENWDSCGGLIEPMFAELQRKPLDVSPKQGG